MERREQRDANGIDEMRLKEWRGDKKRWEWKRGEEMKRREQRDE